MYQYIGDIDMTTEQIIEAANKITNNKISQSSLENFCSIIIQSLLNKFGKNLVYKVVNDESGGEINNVLTHVVEVGSIAYMNNVSLIIEDSLLPDRCYCTVFLMNKALHDSLRKFGLLNRNSVGYYDGTALDIITERVYNLAKLHLRYPTLPENIKNDTFSTEELFAFYLGDYIP